MAVVARRGMCLALGRIRPPSHAPSNLRRLTLIPTGHSRHASKPYVRRRVRTVVFLAALLISTVALVDALGNPGGATTLTSANGYTTLTTIGTVTAGTPYSSGQQLDVNVAANTVMNSAALSAAGDPSPSSGNFYVEECTDPGASTTNLPTNTTGCEATTLTTAPNSGNGGITLSGAKAFIVYDLPDPGTLGPGTMTGSCDVNPNSAWSESLPPTPKMAAAWLPPPLLGAVQFG